MRWEDEHTVRQRQLHGALVESSNPHEFAAARSMAQLVQRCSVNARFLRQQSQQNANQEPQAQKAVRVKPKGGGYVRRVEYFHATEST